MQAADYAAKLLSDAATIDEAAAVGLKLVTALKQGKIQANEIKTAYRTQYLPAFQSAIQKFLTGKLFIAQGLIFEAWIDYKDRLTDKTDYDEIDGLAFLCSEPVPPIIHEFWIYRIIPSKERRMIVESHEYLAMNRAKCWEW